MALKFQREPPSRYSSLQQFLTSLNSFLSLWLGSLRCQNFTASQSIYTQCFTNKQKKFSFYCPDSQSLTSFNLSLFAFTGKQFPRSCRTCCCFLAQKRLEHSVRKPMRCWRVGDQSKSPAWQQLQISLSFTKLIRQSSGPVQDWRPYSVLIQCKRTEWRASFLLPIKSKSRILRYSCLYLQWFAMLCASSMKQCAPTFSLKSLTCCSLRILRSMSKIQETIEWLMIRSWRVSMIDQSLMHLRYSMESSGWKLKNPTTYLLMSSLSSCDQSCSPKLHTSSSFTCKYSSNPISRFIRSRASRQACTYIISAMPPVLSLKRFITFDCSCWKSISYDSPLKECLQNSPKKLSLRELGMTAALRQCQNCSPVVLTNMSLMMRGELVMDWQSWCMKMSSTALFSIESLRCLLNYRIQQESLAFSYICFQKRLLNFEISGSTLKISAVRSSSLSLPALQRRKRTPQMGTRSLQITGSAAGKLRFTQRAMSWRLYGKVQLNFFQRQCTVFFKISWLLCADSQTFIIWYFSSSHSQLWLISWPSMNFSYRLGLQDMLMFPLRKPTKGRLTQSFQPSDFCDQGAYPSLCHLQQISQKGSETLPACVTSSIRTYCKNLKVYSLMEAGWTSFT